jgi:chaperonin GroES
MILFQDKVLIRKDPEKVKEGSIFLPEQRTDFEPFTGTVIQAGPGKVFCVRDKDDIVTVKGAAKTALKPGDKVMCQKNTEYEIKVNDEWLVIVKEGDIIGVLE